MPLKSKLDILIPDADNDFALFAARCLSRIDGINIHLLSNSKFCSARFSRYVSSYEWCDHGYEDASFAEAICRNLQKTGANVVLPTNLPAILNLARFREMLPSDVSLTPLADSETLEMVVDKGRMARFLSTHDIPHPETIDVTEKRIDPVMVKGLSYPVLLKPSRGSGGMGIKVFHSVEELAQYFDEASVEGDIIIQEYITGQDVDISLLCQDGEILAWTVQYNIHDFPHEFSAPKHMKFMDNPEVLRVAEQICRTLNWNGCAHLDMRVDALTGKVYFIELNPRFWGSLIGSLCAGVNFPWVAVLAALGEPVPAQAMKPVSFSSGFRTFKLLLQHPISNARPELKNTSLYHCILDPLPAAFRCLRKLM